MPVYPFLAILAAYAVVELVAALYDVLARRITLPAAVTRRPLEIGALVAVLVFVLWSPTATSMRRNHLVTLPDTGSIAAEWIEARFPPGTHFAIERHTPVLDRKRYKFTENKRVIDIGVAHHREAGVEYLIVSSTSYRRFGPEHRQTKNYQKLFAICPLVREFKPESGRIYGPTIRVLQVPAAETS